MRFVANGSVHEEAIQVNVEYESLMVWGERFGNGAFLLIKFHCGVGGNSSRSGMWGGERRGRRYRRGGTAFCWVSESLLTSPLVCCFRTDFHFHRHFLLCVQKVSHVGF